MAQTKIKSTMPGLVPQNRLYSDTSSSETLSNCAGVISFVGLAVESTKREGSMSDVDAEAIACILGTVADTLNFERSRVQHQCKEATS